MDVKIGKSRFPEVRRDFSREERKGDGSTHELESIFATILRKAKDKGEGLADVSAQKVGISLNVWMITLT